MPKDERDELRLEHERRVIEYNYLKEIKELRAEIDRLEGRIKRAKDALIGTRGYPAMVDEAIKILERMDK